MSKEKIRYIESFVKNMDKLMEVLSYPEATRAILEGDDTKLMVYHREVWDDMKSCIHNADARSTIQYGQNLAMSWIVEDYLMLAYNTAWRNLTGIDAYPFRQGGGDADRIPTSNKRVSCDADLVYEYNGVRVNLEVVQTYTDRYTRIGKHILRDNKLKKLKSQSKNARTYVVGVGLKDGAFFVNDISRAKGERTVDKWSNKPVNNVIINDLQMGIDIGNIVRHTFNKTPIGAEILELRGGRANG